MVGAKPGLNRKRESEMLEKKLYTVTVIVEVDEGEGDEPETVEDICEWVEMLLVGDPDAKDQLSNIRRSRYWYIKVHEGSLHAGDFCTVVPGKHVP